ncbi:PREDICTED: homocysteine S-methyltransferase [Drosophila arizonae]|uniref:Homocysteine S-methyltransferase n=1 Tax=Drosophila arizonae TaxID=7263 RepID=A0ABM1NT93_DROAR|nr:PREDICTED: homocysteine S-methyltransferase [Drosophila arizonae]
MQSQLSRSTNRSKMMPEFTGNWHQHREKPRILVKCGGFSSQLARNVNEKVDGDPLWGSRFDATQPDAVIQTHLDFLRKGADIILTNTYQSSVEGFMKHLGKTREESIALIAKSVDLARQARTKYLSEVAANNGDIGPGMPWILASIGPYGAHLHDGSEYTGSYANLVNFNQLQKWHKPRIDTCLSAGVDGLAVETLPCQLEALAVTDLLLTCYGTPRFWVSFQCKDSSSLAHGESFAEAALAVWNKVVKHKAQSRLMGIGVNCVNPNHVTPLLKSLLAKLPHGVTVPLVVYSNRGEIYDSDRGEWTGNGLNVASFVPEWLRLGVRIIGGCCRVYPDDIYEIRQTIEDIAQQPQSPIQTSLVI